MPEDHGDGDVHFATEVGGAHFAVFASSSAGRAPAFREAGCSFVGFTVDSVAEAVEAARRYGAPVLQEPENYPWGIRAVVVDPDGRPVEIFERPGS